MQWIKLKNLFLKNQVLNTEKIFTWDSRICELTRVN